MAYSKQSLEGSIIIQYYQSLSKPELRQFSDFVVSPFFNKNKDVTTLHIYLSSLFPEFPKEALGKELILLKLRKSDIHNLKQINHLVSYLIQLFERYFAHKLVKDNKSHSYLNALKVAYHKKNNVIFQRIHKKISIEVQKDRMPLSDFYDYKYKISHLDYLMNYWNCTDCLPDKFETMYKQSEKEIELRLLYLELLKIPFNYTYNVQFTARELLIKSENKNIDFFHTLFRMFVKKEIPMDIYKVLGTLRELDLSKEDIRFACINILDYLIHDELKGVQIFTKERFLIYELMVEKKLMVVDKIISNHIFDSVVHQSCLMEEFDFAKKFIDDYGNYLNIKIRKDTIAFNRAMVSVYQGEYENVACILLQLNLYDFKFDIKVSGLLLRLYFFNDEPLLFNNCILALKARIRRKKNVSKSLKEQLFGFLSLANRIMSLKTKKSKISEEEYFNIMQSLENSLGTNNMMMGKADLLYVLEHSNIKLFH